MVLFVVGLQPARTLRLQIGVYFGEIGVYFGEIGIVAIFFLEYVRAYQSTTKKKKCIFLQKKIPEKFCRLRKTLYLCTVFNEAQVLTN